MQQTNRQGRCVFPFLNRLISNLKDSEGGRKRERERGNVLDALFSQRDVGDGNEIVQAWL